MCLFLSTQLDCFLSKAFFVVAIFEANWALRLLVVEPMVRLVIGIRGDQFLSKSININA